jgi:hypothetical protein
LCTFPAAAEDRIRALESQLVAAHSEREVLHLLMCVSSLTLTRVNSQHVDLSGGESDRGEISIASQHSTSNYGNTALSADSQR